MNQLTILGNSLLREGGAEEERHMSKIETVKPDVDQSEHLLRDDELAAVFGARAGGDQTKYMEFKLEEVFISSV